METVAYYLFHAFAAQGYLGYGYPTAHSLCYGFGYYHLFCERVEPLKFIC